MILAKIRIKGIVQGVGFRPFVYRLGQELGLRGWVLNDTEGVLTLVSYDMTPGAGAKNDVSNDEAGSRITEFCVRLKLDAPPMAVVDSVEVVARIDAASADGAGDNADANTMQSPGIGISSAELAQLPEAGFRILPSPAGDNREVFLSPDIATCPDCRRELLNPQDRRYRYPFINCTNCGPRYSIIQKVPYDRPNTTMRKFRMCPRCQREYEDPADRRFHAQPDACGECGPEYRLLDRDGNFWYDTGYNDGDAAKGTLCIKESAEDIAYDKAALNLEVGNNSNNSIEANSPKSNVRGYNGTETLENSANANRINSIDYYEFILRDASGSSEQAISTARRLLAEGKILAVKGIGGYHLACDARNEDAVYELRRRKHRWAKPLAVMVGSLAEAKRLCNITAEEEQLLTSSVAPIVLASKKVGIPDKTAYGLQNAEALTKVAYKVKAGSESTEAAGEPPKICCEEDKICCGQAKAGYDLAEQVAPDNAYLGVMLPYAPIHYLLLEEQDVLVMTSANISEEPIVYRDEEAVQRLGRIADAFLTHNREIANRVDDSVVRVVKDQRQLIRRSRGMAPAPIRIKNKNTVAVLACGAELKNTFCITKPSGEDSVAFVSEHIGDLANMPVYESYRGIIQHYKEIFNIEPKLLACDMHPEYLSTKYAHELAKSSGLSLIEVQHHHAHIGAVLAEHLGEPLGGADKLNTKASKNAGDAGDAGDAEHISGPIKKYAGSSALSGTVANAISNTLETVCDVGANIPVNNVEENHKDIVYSETNATVAMGNNILTPSTEVIGIALDGTGYGDDGKIWGGEFFVCSLLGYKRKAHFKYAPLCGGEKAVKEPWRLALWELSRIYGDAEAVKAKAPYFTSRVQAVLNEDSSKNGKPGGAGNMALMGWPLLLQAAKAGLNSPLTSSAGRLFDAAGAILGICPVNHYEGQSAIMLEQVANRAEKVAQIEPLPYNIEVSENGEMLIDLLPAFRELAADPDLEEACASKAYAFHLTIANLLVDISQRLRAENPELTTVAMAGGVFQNRLLIEMVLPKLESAGFKVLLNKQVPPNDGGLSLGQAAIALAKNKQ